MLKIIRRFRRWRYAKRCAVCNRKFMWRHACKDIQENGAVVNFKTMEEEKTNV